MLALYILFTICTVCPCSQAKLQNMHGAMSIEESVNPLDSNSIGNTTPLINYTDEVGYEDNVQINDTTLFKTFFNVLIDVSVEQVKNIRDKIISNFKLSDKDGLEIKKIFADLQLKYLAFVRTRLKQIIATDEPLNVTDQFMIDFMDVSNYIFDKVIEFYVQTGEDKGNMGEETKWNHQTARQKLIRQEIKISINHIENHMCDNLQVCRDRYYYSDYLIDWIRTLMKLGPQDMKRFFTVVPEVLEKHKHLIKSNIKFRQTIKYLINADASIKKDILDFVDDILTNPDKIGKTAPPSLKKSVTLLRDMFILIDGAYDVNDQNVEVLENITEWLYDWTAGKQLDVHKILNSIVENIQLNIRIWPLDVQNKIYYIWSEVLLL